MWNYPHSLSSWVLLCRWRATPFLTMCLDLDSYPKFWVQMLVVHILGDVYFFLLKFVRKTGAKTSQTKAKNIKWAHTAIPARACHNRQGMPIHTVFSQTHRNHGSGQESSLSKSKHGEMLFHFVPIFQFSSIDESHSQVRFFLPLFSDSGDHHRWRGGGRQVRGEVEGTQRGREGKKEGGDASGVKGSWEIPWRMVMRGALRTKNSDLMGCLMRNAWTKWRLMAWKFIFKCIYIYFRYNDLTATHG